MKRLLLLFAVVFLALGANAQFTTYHSTYEEQEAQNNPVQTVYGYIPTSNGWVRVSIRVKETSSSVLVVGYKEKDTSSYGGAFTTYGNPNPWRSCRAWAESVSVFSDGREIANNFDFKASISGLGTVYF